MYFKIFYPLIILSLFQVFSLIFYQGFSYRVGDASFLLVLSCYFSFLFSIFLGCSIFCKKKINFEFKYDKYNWKDLCIFMLTLFFIVKPTIILFGLTNEYNYDYVRTNFFSSNSFKELVFGNLTISLVTQIYVVPLLWFYVFLLINQKNKIKIFLFYFLLISLVAFNLSYAGRFYIYFAIIVLYMKNLIEGHSLIGFFKRHMIIVISLIFFSLLMANLRANKDGLATTNHDFLVLMEYHLLPPYFLAQKIDDGSLDLVGYPFRTLIEGVFAPILPYLGLLVQDIPQLKYLAIFNDSTLYSNYSGNYYNAFSTFFAYVYADYKYLSPIFVFCFVFFIFYTSYFIKDQNLRVKYLAYICLMFYFSLFQSTIFTSGTMLLMLMIPFYHLVKNVYLKKGFN